MRCSRVEIALRCYPHWWTERYGEEMRATVGDLASEGRSDTMIALSLFRDAVRSRVQGHGMPQNYGLLAARTRMSITAATIPWLVVAPFVTVITGQVFLHSNTSGAHSGISYYFSFFGTGVLGTSAHGYRHPPLSSATQVLGVSSQMLSWLTLITFLVLASGWSACRDGVKHSTTPKRRRLASTSRAPFIIVLLIIVMKIIQSDLSPHNFRGTKNGQSIAIGGHPAAAALLGDATWTLAIVGWILAIALAIWIARKVDLPPLALRFGRTVSVVTASLTLLSFFAFATWCMALVAQSQQLPDAGTVTASYPHDALWFPVALAFAIAVAVSVLGATNAKRSWRTISSQRLWSTQTTNRS
jgi:hypothetical protein